MLELKNNAQVIEYHEIRKGLGRFVVLAKYGKEFVTWVADSDGWCCWGHYHNNISEASQDYSQRIMDHDEINSESGVSL